MLVSFSIVKKLIINELAKYLQPYFAHNQEFNFWELGYCNIKNADFHKPAYIRAMKTAIINK